MDKPTIAYTPLPSATPESELDALVAIYAFVLGAHAMKKAAAPSGQENGVKEDVHVHTKGRISR